MPLAGPHLPPPDPEPTIPFPDPSPDVPEPDQDVPGGPENPYTM